jgi:hypothetical protein
MQHNKAITTRHNFVLKLEQTPLSDKNGKTALELAKLNNQSEILELFELCDINEYEFKSKILLGHAVFFDVSFCVTLYTQLHKNLKSVLSKNS